MPDARTPRPRKFPGDRPLELAPHPTPDVPLEVVRWLERTFPEVTVADPHRLGQRSVALFVRAAYEKQQESN